VEKNEAINAILAREQIEVRSTFVPFSQSRNKGEKSPSLNWTVTLMKQGKPLLTTDYGAGYGHCPGSKHPDKYVNRLFIDFECEAGIVAGSHIESTGHVVAKRVGPMGGKSHTVPIEPNTLDVVHSLLSDGDALDHDSFESWADNYGYETDSRKAEATYRACLGIGLKLRNAFGEKLLTELREAFQDY
jgi:hypothetical protein